jgi:hypothetical protein
LFDEFKGFACHFTDNDSAKNIIRGLLDRWKITRLYNTASLWNLSFYFLMSLPSLGNDFFPAERIIYLSLRLVISKKTHM